MVCIKQPRVLSHIHGGSTESVPHPLHSRTQADGEQPHLAKEEAMEGDGRASSGFCLDPAPITATRFHWRSKSPGQACHDGAEVIPCPPGWTRNILTMHSLPHNEALHLGPLVHPSGFTGVEKKAQRHKAICLRSHSSQWKTSVSMTFRFSGSRTKKRHI